MAPNDIENSSITVTARRSCAPGTGPDRPAGCWTAGSAATNEASSTAAAASSQHREGRRPAPVAALDQAEAERPDAGGDQDGAQRVRPWHRMAGRVRQPEPADHQRGQPDRHVDQEHPAPADRDQQAADDRPERGGHATGGGPGADRTAAPVRRVAGQHQAERSGREQGRAGRLDQPNAISMATLVAAPQAAEAAVNTATPSRKPLLAPVPVGQPAHQHEQRGVDDRVAVEHPGQVAQAAAAQVPRDRRAGPR